MKRKWTAILCIIALLMSMSCAKAQSLPERGAALTVVNCEEYINLAWRSCYCGLFRVRQDGVTWYLIDNRQYFDRSQLYGYDDDGERFGFFSRAVVKMLDHMKFWPDVIHCNDWQTALVPIYLLEDKYRIPQLANAKSVFTIHNIEYQGRYGFHILGFVASLIYLYLVFPKYGVKRARGMSLAACTYLTAYALMLVLFIFVPALNEGTVGIMVPVSVVFTIAVSRVMYKRGVL